MDNDLIQDTNLDLLQVQVASVEYNGQQTTVLFINSLHLYNNKSRSIIYKATALLTKCIESFEIIIL